MKYLSGRPAKEQTFIRSRQFSFNYRKNSLNDNSRSNTSFRYFKESNPPISWSKDIFLYHIRDNISVHDIKRYCNKYGVNVSGIEKISNINAKFFSFKLTVDSKFLNQTLNSNFWPNDVRVRLYRQRN